LWRLFGCGEPPEADVVAFLADAGFECVSCPVGDVGFAQLEVSLDSLGVSPDLDRGERCGVGAAKQLE
jgi:hypothetical protein